MLLLMLKCIPSVPFLKKSKNMDKLDEIKKLKEMVDQGILTTMEFEELKKKIINPESDAVLENPKEMLSDQHTKSPKFRSKKRILLIIILVIMAIIGFIAIKNIDTIKQKLHSGTSNKKTEEKGAIVENGEKLGILIVKTLNYNNNKNGIVVDIPDGKVWMPIYFEYTNNLNCEYIAIPQIFVKRKSSSAWDKRSSYSFPSKDDFVSYKASIRNNKALAGEKAIMIEDSRCKSVTYTFYFLEQ